MGDLRFLGKKLAFKSVEYIIDTMRIRTNGTQLSAKIQLPAEAMLELKGKIPPNLNLQLTKAPE